MEGKYAEVCESILKYKDHRDGLIRRAVISLLPDLAAFDPDQFVSTYLGPVMSNYLVQLKKDKERPVTFIAVGKVAIAVHRHISPYLESILKNVTEVLILAKTYIYFT